MVTVGLNGTLYRVASSWQDIDTDKLIAPILDQDGNQVDPTLKHELAALSDIPISLLDRVNKRDLFPLYTLISFIHEVEWMPYVEPFKEDGKPLNLELEQYRDFEAVKVVCKEGKPYQRVIRAAKIFYPNEKNSVRLVGMGLNIVEQLAVFLSRYEDMIKAPPEKNEVEAGIETLTVFRHWGTAFVMAGRDLLKVDAILSKPAIEVYTAMHYSFREHKYNKEKWRLDHPVAKK